MIYTVLFIPTDLTRELRGCASTLCPAHNVHAVCQQAPVESRNPTPVDVESPFVPAAFAFAWRMARSRRRASETACVCTSASGPSMSRKTRYRKPIPSF